MHMGTVFEARIFRPTARKERELPDFAGPSGIEYENRKAEAAARLATLGASNAKGKKGRKVLSPGDFVFRNGVRTKCTTSVFDKCMAAFWAGPNAKSKSVLGADQLAQTTV